MPRPNPPRSRQHRARTLRNPARVRVEIAISKITGRLLLRVMAGDIEQFWAEGIGELTMDMGKADLLVLTPDGRSERRPRDD